MKTRDHVHKRLTKGVYSRRDLPEPEGTRVGTGKTCQTSWRRSRQIRVRDGGPLRDLLRRPLWYATVDRVRALEQLGVNHRVPLKLVNAIAKPSKFDAQSWLSEAADGPLCPSLHILSSKVGAVALSSPYLASQRGPRAVPLVPAHVGERGRGALVFEPHTLSATGAA